MIAAYHQRVHLSAAGFYRTEGLHWDTERMQGSPFKYFAYGAAATEVEVDGFTGAYRTLRVDILHDVGDSLSPIIDLGQVEGAFVQGAGWLTLEELRWDESDGPGRGRLLTQSASTYKLPSFSEMPEEFNVRLLEHAAEDGAVYGSKAVGEPPLMLAFSVREALREAAAAFGPAGHCVELRSPGDARGGVHGDPRGAACGCRRGPRVRRDERIGCRDRARGIAPARRVRHLSRGFAVDWVDAVQRLRAARMPFVIVTLAMVRGHAPRNGGAKMVVAADSLFGTVGGGNLEATAVDRARAMLDSGAAEPELLTLTLSDKAVTDYGVQCCGGEVTMLLEPVRVVPSVAIFGIGHVGLELARVLSRQELELHLVDSRAEMLAPDRLAVLADAVATVHVQHLPVPEAALADLPAGAHVLVMTHDHGEDLAIVESALNTPGLGSIGLIGSRSKWARFRAQLIEVGARRGRARPGDHADRHRRHRVEGPCGDRGERGRAHPAAGRGGCGTPDRMITVAFSAHADLSSVS